MRKKVRFLGLLLFLLVTFCCFNNSYAQSVSITQVDPGPYTSGSSLAVRISIDPSVCLSKNNVFTLQLSDASGSFATPKNIGSNNGFGFNGSYASFINGVLPSVAPGTGYKLRVVTSNPITIGAASAAISIVAGTVVTAAASGSPTISITPEVVFGYCIGQNPPAFLYFTDASTNSILTTANSYDESDGHQDGGTVLTSVNTPLAIFGKSNYTLFVRSQSLTGTTATKAYLILNNVTNTNFATTSAGPICLPASGGAAATYSVSLTGANGLQLNYPGMLYSVDWGDGTIETFTYCQILQLNGQFTHNYLTSSCGQVSGSGSTAVHNAYQIAFGVSSPFNGICTPPQPFITYQPVLAPPTNSFTGPTTLCTGATATYINTSYPGQSSNTVTASCLNTTATYTWFVDGVAQQFNSSASGTFNWTFTTNGNHTVSIHYDNTSSISCTPADKTINVCVQNAPTAKFNLSPNTVCNLGTVNVTDASIIDNSCNSAYTYKYTVTPATGFSFGGGTSLTSKSPIFNFTTAGKYTVKLQVTPPNPATCVSNVFVDTIYVNGPTVAALSPDFAVCGNNKTYHFDNTAGSLTKTTLTGTFQTLPTTYNWVITPPAGGAAAVFTAGTSASQYPTINFPSFGTYNISVTQTNGCSTSTANQNITFQNAPTITETAPTTSVCPGTSITLTSTLSDPSLASGQPHWTSNGTGVFSDPNSYNTSYTPSVADITAGSVMLTVTQATTLIGTCSSVSDSKVVTIFPVNNVNSAASKGICNGSNLGYNITSTVSGSTFTWTATGSANATGFAASGSGNLIDDVLNTTTPTANAIVTYIITPHANGCDGTPFTLTVTVTPVPTLVTTPALANTICSNNSAAIGLSSNITSATFKWSAVSSSAQLTGYTQHITATAITQITDLLVNNGTTAADVTYTIVAYNGNCASSPQTVTITVQPKLTTTVSASTSICSGSAVGIAATSNLSSATYTWTATSTDPDITGYNSQTTLTADGTIHDLLVNNGTAVGTVTYTITPSANGCDLAPIVRTVTVTPVPTITATGPAAPLCSGTGAGIALTSNLTTTQYTWAAVVTTGTLTGYSQVSTPATVSQINDILLNTGTTAATITYTITAHNGACTTTATPVTITVQPQIIITSTPNSSASICSGNNAGITVNSNLANTIFTWTATTSNATTISGFNSGTNTGSSIQINDILVNAGTTTETVTYTINTIANGCAGTPKTIVISVAPAIVLTTNPASNNICSNLAAGITMTSNIPGTTYSWVAVTSAGASITGVTQRSTPATGGNIPDILVNNSTSTATVTYTITAYANGCTATSNPIVITVQPRLAVTVTNPTNICSNQLSAIQLNSTVTGINYTWSVVINGTVTGATTNSTPVTIGPNDQLINNGTAVGTVTYTITAHANGCDNQLTPIIITVAPTPAITATPPTASICSGQPSNISLTSNISTTKYTWAVNVTGNITGAVAQTTPITLTSPSQLQQILYNRGSTPGTVTYTISAINSATASNCPSNTATVTITVQPAPVTANAGPDANVCGVSSYQLQGNNLGVSGSGLWMLTSGQTGVTFNDATNATPTVSGLVPGQSYTFRYTSKGLAPCNDTFDDVVINDQIAKITADFALVKSSNCDPVTVNFANNSTPVNGLTYAWDFGNGTTSILKTPPAVTYTAQANGKDSTYTIKLTITNTCSTDTKTVTFTVKAARPIVAINPNKTLTCAPFNLVLQNLSPGTNISYTYYLTNASGATINTVIKTDKSDQVFAIPDPGTYKVYMVAQSECGAAQTATYTIVLTPSTAFPRLTVNGNEGIGCAPLTVTFHNNSTGTTSYRYEWGDGTSSLITANSNDVTHTFLKGGTYTVKLFASNGCTIDAPATPVTVNVLYQPTPSFSADNTTGCKNLAVQFKNTTTDPASSQLTDLKYDWDFGDGSAHSSAINPSHHYTYKNSPYTVTLTATNLSGCSNVVTQANFITVNGSSLTDFVAKPDSVISIPDYKFNFTDLTTNNPRTWKWDFGDGSSSSQQNPSHTYADTGLYKVTLTSANAFCDSTKSHYVRIIGVPGQVYIPNAFMPNSVTPSLRTFILKGSGLKTWSFQIYNNYGQMVFQSNKLNEKGEPTEAWDGTFNGVQVQQGTYVWQASGTFINGNEWKGMSYNGSPPKHTGIIYLIK